jgi:hypothetical protein
MKDLNSELSYGHQISHLFYFDYLGLCMQMVKEYCSDSQISVVQEIFSAETSVLR